ncbi:MAG: hypothetical protein HYS55_03445 [Candidatus Omnitrophica bacterium]|nr:hypothetical protein [Candidatus Omnitrophota bacterium]
MAKGGWGRGWQLILSTLKILQRHPLFLIPIIVVWAIYAPIIIYLKYFFPWGSYNFGVDLGVVFLTLFILSFIILFSCSVVLELIQQLEGRKELSLIGAFQETVSKNMIKILPITLIWAIIWFILTIIEALLSRKKKGKEDFNAENVAKTLAGYSEFSLGRAFFEALEKGIRMIVFLILPAVVWEDLSFIMAIKKGFRILKAHLAEFASGYALTYAAAVIVFLPPAIIFELGTGQHSNPPLIHFPDSVWTGVTVYIGFAWSFCMYLEQMFTASLYLWHLKWERKVELAKKQGQPLPEFKDVERPSLLDNVPDLLV